MQSIFELDQMVSKYIESKNYIECMQLIDENLKESPNNSKLFYLQAICYYKQGKLVQANKAIKKSLDNQFEEIDEVYLLAAKIGARLLDNSARMYIDKVRDLTSANYMLVSAIMAYYTENYNVAYENLTKIIRINKRDYETNKYYALTIAALNSNDQQVFKYLKKANKIDIDDELEKFWIEHLLKLGMTEECKTKCFEVLSEKRTSEIVRFAEEVLTKLESEYINNSTNSESSAPIKVQNTAVTTANLKEALQRLNDMVGLEAVKHEINKLVKVVEFEKVRARNHGLHNPVNNRLAFIFNGNPGTGKTTVARLIGDILYHLEILESGHTIEVDRTSLVSDVIGGTTKQTLSKLKEAHQGILFVDEAYTLTNSGSSNDFGPQAIEAIMKYMEDNKGDIVIIFAGYYEEMLEFLRVNPGVKSRISNHITFEDFTEDEMLKIALNICEKKNYSMTENGKIAYLQNVVEKQSDRYYSNARDAEGLIQEAILNLALETQARNEKGENLTVKDYEVLDARHFGVDLQQSPEERIEESLHALNQLVGLETAKQQVSRMVSLVNHQQQLNKQNVSIKSLVGLSKHMLFIGNPGTGKTTVANYLADIYRDMGILKSGKVIVKTPHEFIAEYIGQTAVQTRNIIKDAYGGILFIDEAYGFNTNSFGVDAIEVLLEEMESNRDKLIVILAGYEKEMNDFLNMNSGLKSRIPNVIEFKDYNPDELYNIFIKIVTESGLKVDIECQPFIVQCIDKIYQSRSLQFGNAREMRNLFEMCYINFSERCMRMGISSGEELITFTKEDFIL